MSFARRRGDVKAGTGPAASGRVDTGDKASTTAVNQFVGNITTNHRVDPSSVRFEEHWDRITPENAWLRTPAEL